jgi:hypothetical protein
MTGCGGETHRNPSSNLKPPTWRRWLWCPCTCCWGKDVIKGVEQVQLVRCRHDSSRTCLDVMEHDFSASSGCTTARQMRRGGYLRMVSKVCDDRRICRCVLRKERWPTLTNPLDVKPAVLPMYLHTQRVTCYIGNQRKHMPGQNRLRFGLHTWLE